MPIFVKGAIIGIVHHVWDGLDAHGFRVVWVRELLEDKKFARRTGWTEFLAHQQQVHINIRNALVGSKAAMEVLSDLCEISSTPLDGLVEALLQKGIESMSILEDAYYTLLKDEGGRNGVQGR